MTINDNDIEKGNIVVFKKNIEDYVNDYHWEFGGCIFKITKMYSTQNGFQAKLIGSDMPEKYWPISVIGKVVTLEENPEYFL